MKLLSEAIAIILLFTSSGVPETKPRMFEIRVDSKIDNCTKRHNVIVETKNIFDAREKAQRVVQYKLTTKVISSREMKK